MRRCFIPDKSTFEIFVFGSKPVKRDLAHRMFHDKFGIYFRREPRKHFAEFYAIIARAPIHFPIFHTGKFTFFKPLFPIRLVFLNVKRLLSVVSARLRRHPYSQSAPTARFYGVGQLFKTSFIVAFKRRKSLLVKYKRAERRAIFVGMNSVRNVPSVVKHKKQIAAYFGIKIRPSAATENIVLVHFRTCKLRSLIAEKSSAVEIIFSSLFVFRNPVLRTPRTPVRGCFIINVLHVFLLNYSCFNVSVLSHTLSAKVLSWLTRITAPS